MTAQDAIIKALANRPRAACDGRGHGTERGGSMLDQPIYGPGLCQCGCGEKTRLAPRTTTSRGNVKGQPQRFVYGHNRHTYTFTGGMI